MISIIIPAYNAEKFLLNSLNSISAQTIKDYEVIVVDDGSTDGTYKIGERFAAQDSRFRVIHQENQGISGARNFGLRNALGDFICFCDSDDRYHPQFLELLYDALLQHPEADMSLGHREIVYKFRDTDTITHPLIKLLTRKDIYHRMFYDFQYASVCSKMYRREALEGLYFRDTATEDIDFNMQLFKRADEIVVVPHNIYFYLQRPDSILHPVNVAPRYIAELNGWRNLYFDYFDDDTEENKSFILQRIYKLIISRFMQASDNPQIESIINRLVQDTVKDFKANKYISSVLKVACLTCIKHPLLYQYGKSTYGIFYRLTH